MTLKQKQTLEAQLWDIANNLRGSMDASTFKDYCLGLIFYKYLSEKLHLFVNNEVLAVDELDFAQLTEEDYYDELEAVKVECLDQLGYYLAPNELFSNLVARGKTKEFILTDLQNILQNIERSTMGTESQDDFDHLFESLDLTSNNLGKTAEQRNIQIISILTNLNKIDFQLGEVDSDVLGDAYEYLIGQFASNAGKKAGEFYTPQGPAKILAKIVAIGKDQLKSVYDPTCGSGSLLLRVAREVKQVADFYGQEKNPTTYNLARMNMILHGVHYKNFDIKCEDTLMHPQHLGKKFEAIVANPPFSLDWVGEDSTTLTTDDRFAPYGQLAPKSKADFAFIQHMLHHLSDTGTMAIVLPHGVLFRGGAEGNIRKFLVKNKNWLDAVIGLPAKLFYGTGIPSCILVFKKCRTAPDNILFVDASQHFEKRGNQNYLREEDITKIIETYEARKSEEKYSRVVPITEIKENDYNLNIPRYVDTFEADPEVDLAAVSQELERLKHESLKLDNTIHNFCNQLDIIGAPV